MLFVGDDWAEDHHDVEIVDEAGRRLARRRFPEGLGGITRLHALIAEHLPEPSGPAIRHRRCWWGSRPNVARGPRLWWRRAIGSPTRSWSCSGPGSCGRCRRCRPRSLRSSPAQVEVIATLNNQIDALGEVVAEHFGRHPDAELITSLPGLGVILAARVLGEFGDDPARYVDAKARKAYAGTAPITKASGTKKVVMARYARNKRLGDALQQWAFCSMRGSAGAKAYYKELRARKIGHQAALRQLANRWVGILHGCLKTGQPYNETLAGTTTPAPPLDTKNLGCLPPSARSIVPSSGRWLGVMKPSGWADARGYSTTESAHLDYLLSTGVFLVGGP